MTMHEAGVSYCRPKTATERAEALKNHYGPVSYKWKSPDGKTGEAEVWLYGPIRLALQDLYALLNHWNRSDWKYWA